MFREKLRPKRKAAEAPPLTASYWRGHEIHLSKKSFRETPKRPGETTQLFVIERNKQEVGGTLSMMDCMCDLWARSPYSRDDHCSGEMRSPASMAMWTIWASCSRLNASYVRNSSFSCISEESSSRFVTWRDDRKLKKSEHWLACRCASAACSVFSDY